MCLKSDWVSRRGFAVGLVAVLAMRGVPAFARGSETSAKSFLAMIYESYLGSSLKAKRVSLDNAASIRRYFSPGLASVILDDGAEAGKPDGPPALGRDPFIGRQEWEIAALSIDVKDNGPAKAIGTVAFTNFGKPERVVLELLKVGDDWRIADIKWDSGSLRGLYRKKWQTVPAYGERAK